MAQRLTKAILAASPNVVRLPTAAATTVRQRCNKQTRQQMKEMRAKWPGRYIAPDIRAKIPDAAALMVAERTPALLLAIALFETLTEEKKAQVRGQCEMLKFTGAEARGAAAMIQLRSVGDSVSLDAAMALLRENGI